MRKQSDLPNQKEMDGKTHSCKGKWRFPECIPDKLLVAILVRLPAQDIYFGARLVCRRWYHMIRTKYFIHKHLEHACYGLLYRDESGNLVFISAREDGGGIINTYKLNYDNKTRGLVKSSCNGLILAYGTPHKGLIYHVANVLTGQHFRLPPCPYYVYFPWTSGIGYDVASTTYKVVALNMQKSGKHGCAILTVGVDISWRMVCADLLPSCSKPTIITEPIITEGFVHWKMDAGAKVMTLNLETEIISEILPPKIEAENTKTWCLSTGRYLSLFVWRGKLVWEVFEMKPKIGEWSKIANICLEGEPARIEMLGLENADIEPFGWVKYPEVLALRVDYEVIIFYNLITCEIGDETLSTFGGLVTLHKNSLELLCGH